LYSEKKTAEVVCKLKSAAKWMIICHENPDGDTLGCGLALYSLGRRLGKSVQITGRNGIPERYAFLPFSADFEKRDIISPEDADGKLIVCVDASGAARCLSGLEDAINISDSVNIDHHGDNHNYCRSNLVDEDASATAEIIMDIFRLGGWKIEEGEAVCLYTALSTDNGNFRFSSTTPRSHICASLLLEAGAKPAVIDDYVNENMSQKVLKLWGLAFSRTEVFAGGVCAMFWLDKKDFESAEADSSSVDGLVNMLLRVMGVKIAAFLTEIEGSNKVSIRTRSPYSARELAALFGGGGHLQAAGAKITGPFPEALARLRTEAERYAADRASAS
jgi:phosphoesterase RecJ-like protein